MSDYSLIIIGDGGNYDPYRVQAIGLADQLRPLDSMSFVMVQDIDDPVTSWFAQIVKPQSNRSQLGNPFDPQSITAYQKTLAGEIESHSAFIRHTHVYDIQLIRQLEGDRLTSITRRPNPGSKGRAAYEGEALLSLSLPEVVINGVLDNKLGRVHATQIPVTVNQETLDYHMLIAGATGSGKSNSVANVIKANMMFGRCTIIFDMKPDYQDMHYPNHRTELFTRFDFVAPFAIPEDLVSYWALGRANSHEQPLAVPACDLPERALIGFISAGMSEPQYLAFTATFDSFKERYRSKDWTYDDLVDYANSIRERATEKDVVINNVPHHKSSYDAMYRRLQARKPEWVDIKTDKNRGVGVWMDTSQTHGAFNLGASIAPERVIVLRVGQGGRDYALFLSYILTETLKLASHNKLDCGVQFIVDEAQNIFQEAGSDMRDLAIDDFKAVIRQGRSKHIGFTICVQSASKVPSDIMTNLNSKIVHRQNSRDDMRQALEGIAPDIAAQALSFEPGKALVSIFKSTALLQTEMYPSPFKITEVE